MISISAVALAVVLAVGIVIYVRQLSSLVQYTRTHNLDLFGRNYLSLSALVSDISFFNELFSGKRISTHHDVELVGQLRKIRVLLWLLIIAGIICQILVVVNAAILPAR